MDRSLAYHNLERSHQGFRLKGRTPAQVLREALGIEELPAIEPVEEAATEPAAWFSGSSQLSVEPGAELTG